MQRTFDEKCDLAVKLHMALTECDERMCGSVNLRRCVNRVDGAMLWGASIGNDGSIANSTTPDQAVDALIDEHTQDIRRRRASAQTVVDNMTAALHLLEA
ncbi:MAG: hypothetical protein WC563_16000 [Brevundimonas sp.]